MAILNQRFSNNAETTLTVAILSTDTTLTVGTTGGTFDFRNVVTASGGFFQKATLYFPGVGREIVKITNIVAITGGYTFTVVRGQEGNTALAFPIGTYVYGAVTADWYQIVTDTLFAPTAGV